MVEPNLLPSPPALLLLLQPAIWQQKGNVPGEAIYPRRRASASLCQRLLRIRLSVSAYVFSVCAVILPKDYSLPVNLARGLTICISFAASRSNSAVFVVVGVFGMTLQVIGYILD
jgi:hypothetical protein